MGKHVIKNWGIDKAALNLRSWRKLGVQNYYRVNDLTHWAHVLSSIPPVIYPQSILSRTWCCFMLFYGWSYYPNIHTSPPSPPRFQFLQIFQHPGRLQVWIDDLRCWSQNQWSRRSIESSGRQKATKSLSKLAICNYIVKMSENMSQTAGVSPICWYPKFAPVSLKCWTKFKVYSCPVPKTWIGRLIEFATVGGCKVSQYWNIKYIL